MSLSNPNSFATPSYALQQEYPYSTNIEPSTGVLVVDSDHRYYGDPFNGQYDIKTEISKTRQLSLTKCILPVPPNVLPGMNLQIKHQATVTNVFNVPTGLYNTSSLSNLLTSIINAEFLASGILDTVTVSFDIVTRSFTISSVGGLPFFIVDSCSFIQYGKYLAPFDGEPLGNVPTTTSITSGTAGLLPFRYVLVGSNVLSSHSKIRSTTSSEQGIQGIIGVIDASALYSDPSIWDISKPFTGVYVTVKLEDSPVIRTEGSTTELPRYFDIFTQDSFGRRLDDVFPDSTKLSLCLQFKLTY